MKIDKIIKDLKQHLDDEVKIHKKVFADKDKSIKQLAKMHLKDTFALHKKFWAQLKKDVKEK